MGAPAVPWIIASLTAAGMGVQSAQHDEALRRQNEQNREAKKAQEDQLKVLNTPKATNVDPATSGTEEAKRKRLNALRAGLMSTVKTSPTGVQSPAGLKTKLG